MRPIDKYIAKNKPLQKSKLSEIDDEILELLSKKYPVKLIHEYITTYRKISVELKYLHRYIKKLKSASSGNTANTTTPTAKVSTASAVEAKPTPTQAVAPVVAKPAMANDSVAEQNQPKQRAPLGQRKVSDEEAMKALERVDAQVQIYDPEKRRKEFEEKYGLR